MADIDGGWYHNEWETRRFSDTPLSQHLAVSCPWSLHCRCRELHLGRVRMLFRPVHLFDCGCYTRACEERSSHDLASDRCSTDHVRNMQRARTCATEDRMKHQLS